MSDETGFKIDLDETFPHLAKAPIVEAVIDIRAKAEAAWEEASVLTKLKEHSPEYPKCESHQAVTYGIKIGDPKQSEAVFQDRGWRGARLTSEDQKHVALFNGDSFVFSRLKPYERWEKFTEEAHRLWEIHRELAHPTEVGRLGLRFINRIEVPVEGLKLKDYLYGCPEPPRQLPVPFANYLHQETFAIPGTEYAVNRTRTIQRRNEPEAKEVGLIVDIDVYTTSSFEIVDDALDLRLAEMRWLKNKTFFGTVTPKVIEMHQ